MSMHKSAHKDMQNNAGQVVTPIGAPANAVNQGQVLHKEIEDYQQSVMADSLRACRCNDECVNLCEQCPNRDKENTNCQ